MASSTHKHVGDLTFNLILITGLTTCYINLQYLVNKSMLYQTDALFVVAFVRNSLTKTEWTVE
jgi:hypothetical protein